MNKNVDKIIYVMPKSPLLEDKFKSYSRLKFYSGTLIAMAKSLNVKEVEISFVNSDDKYKLQDTNWKDEWWKYREVSLLNNELHDIVSPDVNLTVSHISKTDSRNSLVILAILNNSGIDLDKSISEVRSLVDRSLGYVYLNSDCECCNVELYSSFSDTYHFLEYLRDNKSNTDDPLHKKFLGIIHTEPPYESYFDDLSEMFNVKSWYLPVIVTPSRLINYKRNYDYDTKFENESGSLMMLRNHRQWSHCTDFFNFIKHNRS